MVTKMIHILKNPDKKSNDQMILKCPKCGWHIFTIQFVKVTATYFRNHVNDKTSIDQIKPNYTYSCSTNITDFLLQNENENDIVTCEKCHYTNKRKKFREHWETFIDVYQKTEQDIKEYKNSKFNFLEKIFNCLN